MDAAGPTGPPVAAEGDDGSCGCIMQRHQKSSGCICRRERGGDTQWLCYFPQGSGVGWPMRASEVEGKLQGLRISAHHVQPSLRTCNVHEWSGALWMPQGLQGHL